MPDTIIRAITGTYPVKQKSGALTAHSHDWQGITKTVTQGDVWQGIIYRSYGFHFFMRIKILSFEGKCKWFFQNNKHVSLKNERIICENECGSLQLCNPVFRFL